MATGGLGGLLAVPPLLRQTLVADEINFFTVPFHIFLFHNSIWDFRNPSAESYLDPTYILFFIIFPIFGL